MRAAAVILLSLLGCSCGTPNADSGAAPTTGATETDDGSDTHPLPDCNTDNEDCAPGTCGGEGDDMLPGANCLACHSPDGDPRAPDWGAGGTIFVGPSGTRALDGAKITVTDSTGHSETMTSNSTGNFYTPVKLVPPINAEVEVDGETISMLAPADNAGCNSCHRCDGEAGAKLHGP